MGPERLAVREHPARSVRDRHRRPAVGYRRGGRRVRHGGPGRVSPARHRLLEPSAGVHPPYRRDAISAGYVARNRCYWGGFMDRRSMLRTTVLGAGVMALPFTTWSAAYAAPAQNAAGPYGPLQPA